MNRQRKLLVTITYNELGIIVDTEAEELDLSAEPQKWNRLMMHLADLRLTYAPADGHGDIKLYEFVTGLIKELEGWEENAD